MNPASGSLWAGMSGYTGLDYGALREIWQRLHVKRSERDRVFFGLLVMNLGASLSGLAVLRKGGLPHWLRWLLVICFPGLFAVHFLIGHIPSGPTFLFAVAWLALGYQLQVPAGQLLNPLYTGQPEGHAHD